MLDRPVTPKCHEPALGRRRQHHIDLPMRMQKKGQSYYYVFRGKWTPLGQDLARAKRKWAEIEDGGTSLTVGALVQKYIDHLAGKKKPPTASSLAQYQSYQRALDKAFPASAKALRSAHVQVWVDRNQDRPTYAHGCATLLTAAWKRGRAWEDVSAEIYVDMDRPEPRGVYIEDAQFRAIREQAKPWMRVAMDLGYLIGPRRSDIITMQWHQVRGELLFLTDLKTQQRQAKRITPELAEVLAQARKRPIVGLYVIANDKGRPIRSWTFNDEWIRARTAAGVEGVQFRDIRAKAATDANADGQDATALLGHASASTTQGYIRRLKTVVADPVRRKI
jgi:hypothetical protein